MHVQSASVVFTAQHDFERKEYLETAIVENDRLVNLPATNAEAERPIATELSFGSPEIKIPTDNRVPIEHSDAQTSLLKALVEAMTGKKIHTNSIVESSKPDSNTLSTLTPPLDTNTITSNERTNVSVQLISEYELSNVGINAQIYRTGQSPLNIQLQITMEREFTQSIFDVLRQEGVITDPLAINFTSNGVALSVETIEFDLNSDGIAELIPRFNSNSAWIALDKNNDGIINNGSELFGPTSGNGFQELSLFDLDQNGFIDSGDSIYGELLAFNPGNGQTTSLNSLGVEALSTQSVKSPFRLTDSGNNTLGHIRSTGFYIHNHGLAGSVQQVDLVV